MTDNFCTPCENPNDHKDTIVAMIFSSHNSPPDRVRELFKPSLDAEGLLVSIFKNVESFRFEIFCG